MNAPLAHSAPATSDAPNGSELVVRDNCVFVTIDYRLGLFGFNCLPALHRGSDDTVAAVDAATAMIAASVLLILFLTEVNRLHGRLAFAMNGLLERNRQLAALLHEKETLVASLREGRALGFGELWAGGWREYGRQFRLLLVSLIPWIVVGIVAALASAWAR